MARHELPDGIIIEGRGFQNRPDLIAKGNAKRWGHEGPTVVEFKCQACGVLFSRTIVPSKTRKYCSRKCLGAANGKRVLGTRISDEQRLKRSRSRRKLTATHRRWTQIIRKWMVYKDWRKLVFERDGYTCQSCGTRNGRGKAVYLEVDHIIPFALRPDLAFVLSNGRTLCKECHRKTKTWGTRVRETAKRQGRYRGYQLPLEMVL